MTSKLDNLRVRGTKYDKRTKLTKEDKERIRAEYVPYVISYSNLAFKYGVSKRLIIFIVNPEAHKKNLEDRKKRGGSAIYYNRLDHNEAVADLRRRKRLMRDEQ